MKTLQDHGKTEIVGIETVGGHEAMHVVIDGEGGFSIGSVSRYQLWLDRLNGFPLKVLSHDAGGKVIEAVEMGELKIGPEFPDGFFKQ